MKVLFDRLVDPDLGLCANDSRFGEAQVVEAVAAWGAGRLTMTDITDLTRRFLESRRVVRLINADPSGRAPGQWSTVTHRAVEDRVLDHLALLEKRAGRPLQATAVAAAIADTPTLGDDQIAAVHTLAASGPALRALIAPAGHGKTTTLATAVDAALRSGRPVLALSTTNQAVDQLRQVGIPAVTVARFTLDRASLEPGSVVILDECSQLPTHEADVVLAAVAACAGGQVWMVGDPLQAQPVRAGGLAPWLAAEIDARRVVAAQLTENRRQADPIEREALTAFRNGQVEISRELRESQGWEHHHRSREAAVAAMAAAVLSDMDAYGAEHIAALAVTHTDCEALADRIRADLTEQDRIGGPTLEGPGWSGPRRYQAGDRILLHANATLPEGRRLTNGTVATVLGVSADGLTILPDDGGHATCLREDFVTRRAFDGRPQVSHAWARTIDGVQGGTWDQVHLLATPALDRYRGYVGQSRSVCPTHTWNTIPPPTGDDHGGRVVRLHSTDADQIAAALARANPKTFAADRDPYRIEKAIQDEQAQHRAHLDRRPPDVTERLAASRSEVIECDRGLAMAKERLVSWQERHDSTSGLRRLSPTLRRMRAEATNYIGVTGAAVERAEAALAAATRRHEHVRRQQAAVVTFDRANQWRIQHIDQLQQQLDDHWTAATVSAARDGNPHAYGPQHLRTARQTLRTQIDGQRQLVADSPLATTVGDPVQALVDLDHAVAHATLSPSLPPVVCHQVQPAQGPGIQIMHEHAVHLGYTQPAPTPSIQI